jgi:hypothetical protein
MAALLSDALRFGSLDLRYQGFTMQARRDEKHRFCLDRLREAREQLVWSIAEGPWLMPRLAPEVVKYGRTALVVVLSYGPRMRNQAARIFDERVRWIDLAQLQLDDVALELNRERPIIRTPRRRRRLPADRLAARRCRRPQPGRRRHAAPDRAGPQPALRPPLRSGGGAVGRPVRRRPRCGTPPSQNPRFGLMGALVRGRRARRRLSPALAPPVCTPGSRSQR